MKKWVMLSYLTMVYLYRFTALAGKVCSICRLARNTCWQDLHTFRYNSITLWTDLAWRHDQWQLTKLTTTFSSAHELGRNGRFGPPPHVVNTIMRMRAAFRRKNGRLYVWPSTEGVLDLCNGAVSEKTPHIF